ncbi:MAG: threonine/serine exporter family protein [Candidatus Cloacimonetes bacterium]|nr:threonine/serine exporter family protein [Candidatus Cloacimonadota bacterium]
MILHLIFIFLVTTCLCFIYQIRKSELVFIGLVSVISQTCFIHMSKSFDLVTTTFFTAFLIGILALYRRKYKKTPIQITSLPPTILLVPGSIGFKMMGTFMGKHGDGGAVLGFEMIFVACAIVLGGMLAEFVFSRELEL